MKTTSFHTFEYTLAPEERVKVGRQFRHIRGLAGTAPYMVRFPDGAPTNFQTGLAYSSPVTLDYVEIINTSESTNTVEIALADGPIHDNRLVGQIDISGGIRVAGNRSAYYGNHAYTNAAKLVRPENQNRASILLQNLGGVGVYISPGSTPIASGILLKADKSITLTCTTAIYSHGEGPNGSLRWLEEML